MPGPCPGTQASVEYPPPPGVVKHYEAIKRGTRGESVTSLEKLSMPSIHKLSSLSTLAESPLTSFILHYAQVA